jgi:serine/threonine protein kinase/HEAT repeat protein/uncharacterized coiled-coil protein SlyX
MSNSIVGSAPSRTLKAVLAERGVLPSKIGLAIFRQLLRQARALHADGATHRAIGPETVFLDATGRATLTVADAVRELDGADADSCPPELHSVGTVRLPAGIEAARQELSRAGVVLDPRRIDVFQLGALLCRMLTGETVSAYLSSPRTASKVPPAVRPLIERALGHCAADRFADCDAYTAALEAAGREAPAALPETPPAGSAVASSPNTPPEWVNSPGDDPLLTRLGHYRVDKRIGRGGMGDVYLGYEESLRRPVAIKVLPAELARDEDFVRRFRAEAAAAAQLAHPNIVPVYFIGQDAGVHFFVMQFVEGESLDRLLTRKGRLGLEEALGVLEQCLAGLGAAHRAGLIHRDVKPGNILIDGQTGRALVADFGLVKTVGAGGGMTATGVVLGTVDYIAPEQARGRDVDGRADLYALGVLAYQMLSGRLPFRAETPSAMIFQHAYETPTPLLEVAPETPGPLAAVVGKLMAKDPAARYQSCEEVLTDFRHWRAGEPVRAVAQQAPAGRPSQILKAPDLEPPPALPFRVETPGRWQHLRGRMLDWFQARAPELVKSLQNTEQQVDTAVAEYQRRRDRLAGLINEAAETAGALAAQAESHHAAAASAARRANSAADEVGAQRAMREREECERVAADLEAQAAEQQEHLARMRPQLVQVDATLARLRGQCELLQARLRVASARIRMEDGPARPRRLRRLAVAAGLGLALLVAGGVFFALSISRPQVKPEAKAELDIPAAEKPERVITNSERGNNPDGASKSDAPALAPSLGPHAADRVAAAGAMLRANPRDPGAIRTLVQGVKDADSNVRRQAGEYLLQLRPRPKAAASGYAAILKGDNTLDVRLRAAEALWDVDRNGPEVLPVLIEGVRDRGMRQRALGIMARLGPQAKDALPTLLPLLQAGSLPNVVCDVFSNIGPDAVPPLMELFSRKGLAGGQTGNMLGSMGSDAAPSLLKLLADPDRLVRSSAIMTLGQVGPSAPEVIPALIEAAQKEDPGLRLTALTALGIAGPEARAAVPILLDAVKSNNPIGRQIALQALLNIRLDPTALPALTEAIKDNRGYVRVLDLELRWRVDRQTGAAVEGLTRILTDSPKDRTACQTALAALDRIASDGQAEAPALAELLNSQEASVRSRAARLLATLDAHAETVVPLLITDLKSSVPATVAKAAEALGLYGTEAAPAIPSLQSLLKNPLAFVCAAAAEALWRIDPRQKGAAMEALLEIASSRLLPGERMTAAAAICQLEPSNPKAVAILREGLSDPEPNTRMSAFVACAGAGAGAGCRDLLALLEAALEGETDVNRVQAATALWKVGGMGPASDKAVAALMGSLKEPTYATVRGQAAGRLGEMGLAAGAAAPALRSALKDRNSLVRSAAAEALRKVNPEVATKAGVP